MLPCAGVEQEAGVDSGGDGSPIAQLLLRPRQDVFQAQIQYLFQVVETLRCQ